MDLEPEEYERNPKISDPVGTLADLVMFGADRTMIETFLHTTSLAVFEGPTVTNRPSGPKKCEKRVIKPTLK